MNNRAPIYVIAWRLLWAAPIYASLILLCLFVGLSYGLYHAQRVWREAGG